MPARRERSGARGVVWLAAAAGAGGAPGLAPGRCDSLPATHPVIWRAVPPAVMPPRPTQDAEVAVAARWLDAVDTRSELLDAHRRRRTVTRLVAAGARPRIRAQLNSAAAQIDEQR